MKEFLSNYSTTILLLLVIGISLLKKNKKEKSAIGEVVLFQLIPKLVLFIGPLVLFALWLETQGAIFYKKGDVGYSDQAIIIFSLSVLILLSWIRFFNGGPEQDVVIKDKEASAKKYLTWSTTAVLIPSVITLIGLKVAPLLYSYLLINKIV